MSKTYIVTGTFTEEVEADNPQEAEAKAIESYMDNPDTDYQVEEVKPEPDYLLIKIERASDGGFMYDIWDNEKRFLDEKDPSDGGLCTTTMLNALDMASEQAKEIVKRFGTTSEQMAILKEEIAKL